MAARPSRTQRYRFVISLERLLEAPATYLAFVFAAAIVADLILTTQGREVPAIITWGQLAIWGFFILHFALGFVAAPARRRYVRRHWLTALSLLIPFLRVVRILRAVRLLRVVNLARLLGGTNRTLRSLRMALAWNGAGYAAGVSATTALVGSVALFMFEADAAGSRFASYGDALWWTAATMTTVGAEGEPISLGGRVVGVLIMLAGLILLGYAAGLLGTIMFGRRERQSRQRAERTGRSPSV
jgi:voltage-gated potassium channel